MTLKERLHSMNFSDRLRAIFSELERAKIWRGKSDDIYKSALGRGLELTELSLDDPTSEEEIYPLLVIKEKLGELYIGKERGINKLYAAF